MAYNIKSVDTTSKYWYLLTVSGILFLIIGVWTFSTPPEKLITLYKLFSISFLINGICDIIFAFANRKILRSWTWTLVLGLFNIILSLIMLIYPGLEPASLPVFVGLLIIFRSIIAIVDALNLKASNSSSWVPTMILGIVSALLGIILLFKLFPSGVLTIIFIGLGFIILGIHCLSYSVKIKRVKSLKK